MTTYYTAEQIFAVLDEAAKIDVTSDSLYHATCRCDDGDLKANDFAQLVYAAALFNIIAGLKKINSGTTTKNAPIPQKPCTCIAGNGMCSCN